MSLVAFDVGIMVLTSNKVVVIAVQVVPLLIVYSIVVATSVIFSVALSNAGTGSISANLLYRVMLLTVDDGVELVAFTLIFKVKSLASVAAGNMSVTLIVVTVTGCQVTPASMEYSIDVDTPVTFSVTKLITALGAATRFAKDIILVSEAIASAV